MTNDGKFYIVRLSKLSEFLNEVHPDIFTCVNIGSHTISKPDLRHWIASSYVDSGLRLDHDFYLIRNVLVIK